MPVRILYFATIREAIGVDHDVIDIPADVATPAALADYLAVRGGGYVTAFADRTRLRCAVDQMMVPLGAPLGTPAEIAFFPPVTGG